MTIASVAFSVFVVAAWLWIVRAWGRLQYRRGSDAGLRVGMEKIFQLASAAGGTEMVHQIMRMGLREMQQPSAGKGLN